MFCGTAFFLILHCTCSHIFKILFNISFQLSYIHFSTEFPIIAFGEENLPFCFKREMLRNFARMLQIRNCILVLGGFFLAFCILHMSAYNCSFQVIFLFTYLSGNTMLNFVVGNKKENKYERANLFAEVIDVNREVNFVKRLVREWKEKSWQQPK